MNSILTVSQLNRYVKAQIEENRLLQDIMVRGEISNLTMHKASGHMYLSLKDKDAMVRAVMFRSYSTRLSFTPSNGMSVIARCQASLYERDGAYQLYIRELQPDGIGALYLAYEQLKAKLAQEGLFDESRKKPLVRFPSVIGVVTSETGAALQDVLSVLKRRYPVAKVLISPALVQGREAPASLISALDALVKRQTCDVILIGRGGGGIEDLWAFNDEALARAIAACPVPVVSGVGHETDYTICDFVADLRAPTPTAAAQLSVPDLTELGDRLYTMQSRLDESIKGQVYRARTQMKYLAARVGENTPLATIGKKCEHVKVYEKALSASIQRTLESKRQRLTSFGQLMDSYRVGRVLERGYSITRKGGRIVSGLDAVGAGDILTTEVNGGEIISEVKQVCRRKDNEENHQL